MAQPPRISIVAIPKDNDNDGNPAVDKWLFQIVADNGFRYANSYRQCDGSSRDDFLAKCGELFDMYDIDFDGVPETQEVD